jgi:hypothetical protein
MSLDMDVSCTNCEDGEVMFNEKDGKAFVYQWFECTSCKETDWHTKRLKKKGLLQWVN